MASTTMSDELSIRANTHALPPSSIQQADSKAEKDNPFIFDCGDVRVLVRHNGERIEGKASSHALSLASPVWKKFLFPPWAAKEDPLDTGEPKQIDFVEDDSAALLVLLNIAHLQFREIPAWLPYELLLQVAVLCDQYDCVGLVRPWLLDTLWLKLEMTEALKSGQHKWMFIAWVSRREQVFTRLALKLVKEITFREDEADGQFNFWLNETPMPPLIIESIIECRKSIITSLLEIPYSLLSKYEVIDETRGTLCTERLEACDVLTYGSIIRNLRKKDLFPRLQPENVGMSVNNLVDLLNTISIHEMPSTTRRKETTISHDRCCVRNLKAQVSIELAKPINPVLPSHHTHLKAQL